MSALPAPYARIHTITHTVQLLVVRSSAQGSNFRCRCLSRSSRFRGHLGDPRCSQLDGRQSLHPSGHLCPDHRLLVTPVRCGLGRCPSVHLVLGPSVHVALRPRVALQMEEWRRKWLAMALDWDGKNTEKIIRL